VRIERMFLIAAALILAAVLLMPSSRFLDAADRDEAKARDAEESEETTRLIKAELPNWEFWKGADKQKALKLEPKSVLRWTNPGTGRIYGDLYLWTADGRPEVVMSLFKAWDPPDGFHAEMHSLSLGELEAERDGARVWQPTQPGVTLRDVPDAPKPADTPVRRLSQMRTLAADFSAVLTVYRRNNSGERQALRMLTQPMYRYQSTTDELVDGAIFAFVLGTDPEVFLLLEARHAKEATRWQFGLARMNNESLAVMHRETEVWSSRRADLKDPLRDPYVLTRVPESPR
jgi:hypothetical protein